VKTCQRAKYVCGVFWAAGLVAVGVAGCASDLQTSFQSHIDYLASDQLEGRGIGSDGIQLAAQYVAAEFREIGLEPINGESYFQTFEMTTKRELGEGRLAFGEGSESLVQGRDFIPFGFSSDNEFEGDVVFCGYGIVAEDREYDDFVDVELTNRVALVLRGEPDAWSEAEGGHTRLASLRNKIYNAKDRGAVAVLIVNKNPSAGEDDELVPFAARGANAYGIPALHITRRVADAQLKRARLDSLATLQDRLDGGSHVSTVLKDVAASGNVVFKHHKTPTHNVVGILRGTQRDNEEFVVVGAHYDHLGFKVPTMRTFKDGKLVKTHAQPEIHHGADDNASGTSGVIEIARRIAAGPKPRRSLIFVAFTAEETGLHGSKRFVDAPPVPLEKIVAMLNMDMIGRLDPESNTLTVFGTGTAVEFGDMLERAASAVDLKLATSEDAGGRSDHASFVRNQIPSLHFYSGNHSDYHKPSDTADKINAVGGEKITRLVGQIARELADGGQKLAFLTVKKPQREKPSGDAPVYRVVMGLAPAYAEDGKPGMPVDAVTAEGPAAMAGMKAGDRIIRIGGKKIANIYDYMAATRGNKPGDVVEVIVLRDGREVTLAVTLAAAG